MFSKLSLKGRILNFTLLPSALLAVALGVGFTWVQVSQSHDHLIERYYIIADQISRLSKEAVATNNMEPLTQLAQQALEFPDIHALHFHNAQGQALVQVGPSIDHSSLTYSASLQVISGYQHSLLIMPIFPSVSEDASEPTLATDSQPLGWLELEVSHLSTLLDSYRIGLITLLVIILGVITTGLLASRAAQRLTQPLQNIRENIAKVIAGDLDSRVEPAGCPDLDQLVVQINDMLDTIQEHHADLLNNIEQSTLDIRTNLETIEIQNIELNKARKEAVETSRIKTEFLTNISHEIRTPLNGILGFSSLLKKSELSPRQKSYLSTIHTSAENLLGILNQVLDFSRLEAGKIVLESMPFSLRDLLHDIMTLLSTSAHEKQLELVSLIYEDTPNNFIGDPLRLQQVLTNLVSNAIKFTHTGHVVVRAMLEDEQENIAHLRFCIQDTGVGLDQQDLGTLFDAFKQATNSTQNAQGSGLGLSISKRLIEQMGGAIGVSSERDIGTEFWFTLPLKKSLIETDQQPQLLSNLPVITYEPHQLARQSLHLQLKELQLTPLVADDLEHLVQQVQEGNQRGHSIPLAIIAVDTQNHPPQQLYQFLLQLNAAQCFTVLLCSTLEQASYQEHLGEFSAQVFPKPLATRQLVRQLTEHFSQDHPALTDSAAAASAPIANTATLNVMCIDDNLANLTLISTLLREMQVNVSSFSDGWSALEAFKVNQPDLVLLDINMPGLDGKQTLQKMRIWEKQANLPLTPIVAVTAHAFAEERRDLKQRGFNDFMTKPVNEQTLVQVVLTWTGQLISANPVASPAPMSADYEDSEQLAVFDLPESIQLAGGRKKLALDLLELLLDSLPADRAYIQQALAEKNRDNLLERVHRLHGATKYCGVPQLRAQCKTCETLLKTPGADFTREIQKLDSCIERVLVECRS